MAGKTIVEIHATPLEGKLLLGTLIAIFEKAKLARQVGFDPVSSEGKLSCERIRTPYLRLRPTNGADINGILEALADNGLTLPVRVAAREEVVSLTELRRALGRARKSA